MNKHIIKSTLLCFLAAALGAPSTLSAQSCSLTSLQGTFGFLMQSTTVGESSCRTSFLRGPDSPGREKALILCLNGPTSSFSGIAGLFSANGSGQLTLQGTISADGFISRNASFGGTYTVNADCSGGSMTFYLGGLNAVTFDFFFVNNRTQLLLVGTDGGSALSGEATKT